MRETRSKLELDGDRIILSGAVVLETIEAIMRGVGCTDSTASQIAHHLFDTSLCGMESHGVMRVLQYAEQMQSGYMKADGTTCLSVNETGGHIVDGGGGSGIPAMSVAYDHATKLAGDNGISCVAIRNVGHTGRHGAYAEKAGDNGFLTICIGGGNRKNWRQVAPYGGAKAVLPTNPWCIGIPGGENGPVVLDFATSKIAGGWIYAARSAGALLPEGCVIDGRGNPTRDPEDYFDGGAILPSGEHKGYAMALMAELIADALLGPIEGEASWLLIALDTGMYREDSALRSAAEEILEELRVCPPAPGFSRVEVPGEREREYMRSSDGFVAVPEKTWQQILDLKAQLSAN